MRNLLFISRDRELANIQKLIYNFKRFDRDWVDEQTLMLMVSPDFSGIVSTIMSHGLSVEGKRMMYTDVIHVPDPTEDQQKFKDRLRRDFPTIRQSFEDTPMEKFIIAEAGVISGRNYVWIYDMLTKEFNVPQENIRTVALFENKHSQFKCDYVGEYYDNETQDLCFWWEKPNEAFGDYTSNQSQQ